MNTLETPLESLENTELTLKFLPYKPSDSTEEIRQEMHEMAKTNLYFMARVVLGYDWLTPHTHGALCTFLDECQSIRRMVLMPRSHLKTTIATIAQTIKDIVNNPDIRILIVASSGANARRFLLEIKKHFESNELFKWLFPELIPANFNKARWNNDELEVPRTKLWREPTVDAIGAGANVESRHYDIIRCDDLVGTKEFQSDAEMDNRVEWCRGIEALLLDPNCRIDSIGTRWKQGDVQEFLERLFGGTRTQKVAFAPYAYRRGARFVCFAREAIEDGKPIFPEHVPLWYLINFRNENPELYAAWYANNPKAEGITVFREEWKRFARWSEKGGAWIDLIHNGELIQSVNWHELDRIILVDPAVSETKKSSRNAIIVTGKGSGPHRIILETRIGHYDPSTMMDYLYELDEKWQPRIVSIEAVAYQRALKYWAEERAEAENLPSLPIVEYEVESEMKKNERIKGLTPLARRGLLWMFEDQIELQDEWDFFPRSIFRDGLDALAQGNRYWADAEDLEDTKEKAEAELERLRAITGKPIRAREDDEWDEAAFLRGLGASGYGVVRTRYNPN